MIYCKNCGKQRPEMYKVCLKCGSREISYERSFLPEPPPNHPIITDKNCPKCGEERSIVKLRTQGDYYGSFLSVFLAHPDLKKPDQTEMMSGLLALVCNNCGFTEFYAEEPKNVLVKRPDKPVEE